MNWLRINLTAIISLLTSVFVGIILILLINQSRTTQKLAESTNSIVDSQNRILQSIKDLANDTKITAEQKTNIIICMLQVPVDERTTDTVTNCRKQAESIASPVINQGTTTPKADPAPVSAAPPTPTPQPTPSDPIVNFLNTILKRLPL